MFKICCPSCKSEEVVIDASAKWDVEGQCWSLSCTYDTITCTECDAEFYQSEGETSIEADHGARP